MKKDNKIIAIQGDPIGQINIKTDTTLLLALEAQRRNYKIYQRGNITGCKLGSRATLYYV